MSLEKYCDSRDIILNTQMATTLRGTFNTTRKEARRFRHGRRSSTSPPAPLVSNSSMFLRFDKGRGRSHHADLRGGVSWPLHHRERDPDVSWRKIAGVARTLRNENPLELLTMPETSLLRALPCSSAMSVASLRLHREVLGDGSESPGSGAGLGEEKHRHQQAAGE